MVAYEKQKIVTSYACFCLETMLSSQTIKEIIEPPPEISGCANTCNKIVSIRY